MLSFLIEYYGFLRAHKKLWMLPIIIIILMIGLILIVAQNSAFAPLIYTLF